VSCVKQVSDIMITDLQNGDSSTLS